MFEKKINISGTFKINLLGQDRDLKATFGAIEKLEENGLSILKRLYDASTIAPKFVDVVDVIWYGLAGNRDTRLTREQIGEAILAEGLDKFAPVYIKFLTYCVTGDKTGSENPLEKK